LTNEGGANRERSYDWFQRNFEPEATIEMANATYNWITENPNSAFCALVIVGVYGELLENDKKSFDLSF